MVYTVSGGDGMTLQEAVKARALELCAEKGVSAEKVPAVLLDTETDTPLVYVNLFCHNIGIDLADFFQAPIFTK